MKLPINLILLTNKEINDLKKVVLDGLIYHKRNMIDAGCDEEEIREYSKKIKNLLNEFKIKGEE